MQKEINYKILPKTFKGRASQKEFQFKQLLRENNIALYEKKSKDITYYETIIIQKHDGRTMPGGVFVEPSEFYPSDNMFGQYGWCYNDKEMAENKYKELCS